MYRPCTASVVQKTVAMATFLRLDYGYVYAAHRRIVKLCGVEQRAPPIFGRAAITLGIGPPSSFTLLLAISTSYDLLPRKKVPIICKFDYCIDSNQIFCTVIKTTKCPSSVVLTHASRIQVGGRPPSWKNSKIAIYLHRFDRFR